MRAFLWPMAMRAAREMLSMTHRPACLAAATAPMRHQVRMVATVTLAWVAAAVVFIGSPLVLDTENLRHAVGVVNTENRKGPSGGRRATWVHGQADGPGRNTGRARHPC